MEWPDFTKSAKVVNSREDEHVKKEKEYAEKIKDSLKNYSHDFIEFEEKCNNCKGRGHVRSKKFIGEKYSDQECSQCYGMKTVRPIKDYFSETSEEIIDRIIKNFTKTIDSFSRGNSDSVRIRDDFINCIERFEGRKVKVSKSLRDVLENMDKKRWYSRDRYIEKLWKMSPEKNLVSLIQIYIKYLLREPSYPQTRDIKKLTGIGPKWYRLSMDYYQCYDMIHKCEDGIIEQESEHSRYSEQDNDSQKKFLKDNKKIINTKNKDDYKRMLIAQQLAWCIEKFPKKYDFDDRELNSINFETRKTLFILLKNNKSPNVKKFLDKWKIGMENYMREIYSIDNTMFEDIYTEIRNQRDPASLINDLLIDDGTKFKIFEDDAGMSYEYKSSTYGPKVLVSKIMSKTKDISRPDAYRQADDQVTEKIKKNICAFLNTEGGIILIGVSDSGDCPGIEVLQDAYKERLSLHEGPRRYPQHVGEFLDMYRNEIQTMILMEQVDIRKYFELKNIKVHLQKIPKLGKHVIIIQIDKLKKPEICYYYTTSKFGSKGIVYQRAAGRLVEISGHALAQLYNDRKKE